jgi:outer membrane protein assembly factor BamB
MLRQISCALLIAVFSSSGLFSADWQMFRGADGNGKSPDTGLLKKWDAGGPKLLWTVDNLGAGFSGVSIVGDKIYISGNGDSDTTMVFCLDKNGKLIWKNDNGAAHTSARNYPGTRGTPTIDGNFVYDISPLGELACYDTTKNGEKVWHKNVMTIYEAPMPMWFLGHSVVIDGDNVITPVGGTKGIAVALNKRTGEQVWVAPPVASTDPREIQTGYTTPYLFDFEGIRVVTVMSAATIEGLDAKTGKKLFTIPWKNQRTTNCTMPIYRDGCLFISNGYGFGAKMFKLSKNADGTIKTDEAWHEQKFDNQHGGTILVGDYVYGSSQRKNWLAVNFMTGEVGYDSKVNGIGQGSIHYADGLLYCFSEDNDKTVVLVKPEPKEFAEISRFELPNDAEGKTWAHPVVLDGRLYIRHGRYLYCYDVKE